MSEQSKNFLLSSEEPIETLDVGIQRQMLGYNNEIMMVKVMFDEGSVGYVHEHFHSQVTYIESGEFDVTIGGELRSLSAGDSYFIEPNVPHGAVCKKAGVLIDVFSPKRDDFLESENKV
jgi:quercetin dioxygenase-like cupin family protein